MFLDGFWRPEIQYKAFIAMPFGADFDKRYDTIIKPAIETCKLEIRWNAPSSKIDVHGLTPFRVDNSKTGDSILTEIMDGIAHSYLVLADLSEVGHWVDEHDKKEVRATPNGNVMYEAGLSLACRQQAEVILFRNKDDKGKLLFDVSTIPCVPIDFSDTAAAISALQDLMRGRVEEIDYRKTHRVQMTLASLTPNELGLINDARLQDAFSIKNTGYINFRVDNALPLLLQKGLWRSKGVDTSGAPIYEWTAFGAVIRDMVPVIKKRVEESPTP
jgi:hypothetical protein